MATKKSQKSPNELHTYFNSDKMLVFEQNVILGKKDECSVFSEHSKIKLTAIDRKTKLYCVDNLDIETVFELYNIQQQFKDGYSLSTTKIFGDKPDKDGCFPARKLLIARNETYKGEKQTSPWIFFLKNGKGKKAFKPNGAAFLKEGTFIEEKAIMIKMNDHEFFKAFNKVVRFLNEFEQTFGPEHMKAHLEWVKQNSYKSSSSYADAYANSEGLQQQAQPQPSPQSQQPHQGRIEEVKTLNAVVLSGTKQENGLRFFEVSAGEGKKLYIYCTEKSLKERNALLASSYNNKKTVPIPYVFRKELNKVFLV